MRAVQRANATAAAAAADDDDTPRKADGTDGDGDVPMGGASGDVSPTTMTVATTPTLAAAGQQQQQQQQPSVVVVAAAAAAGLDVTWLDDDSVDLIARTVEEFRGQRLSMVQSLRQFVLCYETALEWVWRLQERSSTAPPGGGGGGPVAANGRARSGSLQAWRPGP